MEGLSAFTVTTELRRDGETVLWRGTSDQWGRVLVLESASDRPGPATLARFRHEYGLAANLEPQWAAKPLTLIDSGGRAALVMSDPGGCPLSGLTLPSADAAHDGSAEGGLPAIGAALGVARALARALAQVHDQGLIHKDINPRTLLVDPQANAAWITGFAHASAVPRERHGTTAGPGDDGVVGTLAYMAPEQTGRMNRSVDTRGDLYSLGVTLFELFTGQRPFNAGDPLEWIHCHIARQPPRPEEIRPDLPPALGDILLTLLAKTPEDRYQTAQGLEADLDHCHDAWLREGGIPAFALGARDIPGRLMVPEQLYGRDAEVARMTDTLERVITTGRPELLLVAGTSGVGKSALIDHLQSLAIDRAVLFGSGKFDLHKRDIPYVIFAQAFQSLIRQILADSEEAVQARKAAIEDALGHNGRLLTDLIPLLETLIGPQPAVSPLPPNEALARFRATFRAFVQVFAQPGRPLILALDDLQWIDAGSLRVLEHLMTHPDLGHLLVIGSFRSNEVPSSHPLALALENITANGGRIDRIDLAPLSAEDLGRLVADSLRATPRKADSLIRVIYGKTEGNPLFAIQLLRSLVDEGLLAVDPQAGGWTWDTQAMRGKGVTENVVDLMATRLGRLPEAVQRELHWISCLGNAVGLDTLALIQDRKDEEILAALDDALRAELLVRDGPRLVFLHDRVREAAYLAQPEDTRAAMHLDIGRRLIAALAPADLDTEIFDVVHQLNQGVALITDPDERARLAALNRTAGARAKASAAHASARAYFRQARALLPKDAWTHTPEATFTLHLDLAETEYLAGHHDAAEDLFTLLLERAADNGQRAAVWRLRLRMFMVAGKFAEAVAVAIEALGQLGHACPTTPEATAEAVDALRGQMFTQLDRVGLDGLMTLPDCQDTEFRALMGLIADAIPAVYHIQPMLYPYLGLLGITLSLTHGVTEDSCSAFSSYSVSLVGRFEDISTGVAFSDLALRLEDRFGTGPLHGTLLFRHGYFVSPWRRPVPECITVLDDAFRACLETGNLIYAGYVAYASGWLLFEDGKPLEDYAARLRKFIPFAEGARIPWALAMIRLQKLLIAALRDKELETTPGKLGADSEEATVVALEGTGHGYGVAFYHVVKQITPYLLGRFELSLERSDKAREVLIKISSSLIEGSHHFYGALAIAALYDDAPADRRATFDAHLAEHRRKLALWAENNPGTFASRHLVVEAEAARIDGRPLEALALFEQAIAAARERGQLPVEGIANERAGLLARDLGLATAADAHLQDARYAFQRWGAARKVRQLDEAHPRLAETAHRDSPAAETFGGGAEGLDLMAVIKAQQAVSGHIILPKLVEALLRIVVEHAGADRGLVLLRRGDSFAVAAEARLEDQGLVVSSEQKALDEDTLALAVFHYVARTRERVVLDNAAAPGAFPTESYSARHGVKSLFCLPVITRGTLTAVVYLENHLATGAFTEHRMAVLDLLASQAAISLENATLYADMEQRVRERTRDLAQSLDMVRAKGEQVGTLLDNSDQGFMAFGRDLMVEVEYSLACEKMLETMPAGQPIDRLLWPDDPIKADLVREVVPTVLDGVDPVRAEMMIGLLPSEIQRGDKVLEAQYKVLDNGKMMLVLTDVTAERRLRERVALEQRHLEMIVAAVTDGHDFFDTVAAARAFSRDSLPAALASGAPPKVILRNIYREVHTLKGLLNQFSFTELPRALHGLEETLDRLGTAATPPTLDQVAVAVRGLPYTALLDQDLAVVSQILGDDFLTSGKRVMITSDQIARLKAFAADLMDGRRVDPTQARTRALLLEIQALGTVSVKQTLRGFDALVQRIASRTNKSLAPLVVEGDEVSVPPETFSPFLRSLGHVLRNAVDHGIEPPEDRVARGKPEEGSITCRVALRDTHLHIDIADDGGGIDPQALRRRASALVGQGAQDALSDEEAITLVFVDGLSTRDGATETSGRGVGMAAVRQAVHDLGGDVHVTTTPGQGSRFAFVLPLTLSPAPHPSQAADS